MENSSEKILSFLIAISRDTHLESTLAEKNIYFIMIFIIYIIVYCSMYIYDRCEREVFWNFSFLNWKIKITRIFLLSYDYLILIFLNSELIHLNSENLENLENLWKLKISKICKMHILYKNIRHSGQCEFIWKNFIRTL